MTWDTVELETDNGVTTITVDRPDRLNALNVETLEALDEALDEAAERDTRVLVITGAGDDAFVAGADLAYMKDLGVQEAQAYSELGHRVMTKVETFPVPSIAAINGYAFGGGCELALAADMRVASERAIIGQVEISVGIIPGWGGIQRLARLVNDEVARRLVYFGDRVDAEDADQHGLVGEVVAHDQLDNRVADLAEEIGTQPKYAMQAAKEAFTKVPRTHIDTGLDYEQRLWAALFDTADQEEGMAAFVEDRDPEWEA
jgi:enoyl-CoA hydratase/carnithine racemase